MITRSDNADERLIKIGYDLGLNSKDRYDKYLKRMDELKVAEHALDTIYVGLNEKTPKYLESVGETKPIGSTSYKELLKRPKVTYEGLQQCEPKLPVLSSDLGVKIETNVKYKGYIDLEEKDVEKMQAMESLILPQDLDYSKVEGISLEAREKLNKIKPKTIGEASRITNVHPADIDRLLFLIRKK